VIVGLTPAENEGHAIHEARVLRRRDRGGGELGDGAIDRGRMAEDCQIGEVKLRYRSLLGPGLRAGAGSSPPRRANPGA
jgi:hypothetical protein